ncbi:hypothetical protein J7K99_02750 [bacterium]|nr:hypothetical protein [bacterium]
MRNIFCFFWAFLIVISVLLFSGCGSDNPSGPDFDDHESPSVSITYPSDLCVVNGEVTIRAEASDNDMVSKVEFFVDGDLVGIDYNEPYECAVDFSTYEEGTHSVTAKAYDRSGNSAVSEPITVIYMYDFAPEGNGYVKVEIVHYLQKNNNFDPFAGDGDPYFIFQMVCGDDTTTQVSETFANRSELWFPYSYEFDIDDNTKTFYLSVWVCDEDPDGYDLVDYVPDPDGRAYQFTLDTRYLPWEATYDGSDDGVPSEPDCELTLRVSISVH